MKKKFRSRKFKIIIVGNIENLRGRKNKNLRNWNLKIRKRKTYRDRRWLIKNFIIRKCFEGLGY
jgi:hypothetical protein